MHSRRIQRSIAGITLIELLIAMSLSLWLLGTLSISYCYMVRNHQLQVKFIKKHEDTKIAFNILRREIQLAGFIGCPRLTVEFLLYNPTSYALTVNNQVQIESGYSDTLTVRHRSIAENQLVVDMLANNELYMTNHYPVSVGDTLLISDCSHVDIFEVKGVSHRGNWQKITSKQALQFNYAKNALVGFLEINTFIVKEGKLYRRDIKKHHEEMVESIQRVKYLLNVIRRDRMTEIIPNEYQDEDILTGISITADNDSGKNEYSFVNLY